MPPGGLAALEYAHFVAVRFTRHPTRVIASNAPPGIVLSVTPRTTFTPLVTGSILVNASDLPEDVKVKLQGYVSGCYGSLTSFNVLFADEADQFKGSGGD